MSPTKRVRGHIWRIAGLLWSYDPYRLEGDPPCDCYDRLASDIWAKRYRNAADPKRGIRTTILESRPKDLAIETSVLHEMSIAIARYISLADVPSADESSADDPWVREGIQFYDTDVLQVRREDGTWHQEITMRDVDYLRHAIALTKRGGRRIVGADGKIKYEMP